MGDFVETDEFSVGAAALEALVRGAEPLGWRLVPATLFDAGGEVRPFEAGHVLGARFELGDAVVGVHVYCGEQVIGQLTLPVEDSAARRAFLAMARRALGARLWPDGDPRAFDAALRALAGERVELELGGAKALTVVLTHDCDAEVRPEGFEVHIAGRRRGYRYYLSIVPQMLTALLDLAGVARPVRTVRAHVGPTTLPRLVVPVRRRSVWLDASDEVVRIRVRDGAHDLDRDPPPLEGPSSAAPRFIDAPGPCPRCATTPAAFRVLQDGALVCPRCGASFAG